MRKQMVAAAMASAMVVASVGLAGPAAAADEWLMPDVQGEILQTAVNDVRAVTGDVELDLRFVTRNVNQNVYNLTNWAVCRTSPAIGNPISQKTKRVIFSVRRPNEKC